MCGIICYLGDRPALPILLNGLRRLEYRGYDSSGVAVAVNDGIHCRKAVGKISDLANLLGDKPWAGWGGIAHTRWATHGVPSPENAHPHGDCQDRIFVVHNGIIENYRKLREELREKGHLFRSSTDSEVLAHLIEEYYRGDLEDAVNSALQRVDGTYGIGVISSEDPSQIVVARLGSPLVLGIRDSEIFAASDAAALMSHTREVAYLHDGEVALLKPGSYRIRTLSGMPMNRSVQTLDWDMTSAEKKGYPHFMLKEVYEQPEVVGEAIRGRLIEAEGLAKLGGLEGVWGRLRNMRRLIILACGTSYYAGLLGRYVIESCTNYPVDVDLASEFQYRKLNLQARTAVLAISQSGETADILAVVSEVKRRGALSLGLVNVVGSTVARLTDAGIYNHAGPEISVASTKVFVSQIAILYLVGLLLGRHQQMSLSEGQEFVHELRALPERMQSMLARAPAIEEIARRCAHYRNLLYLGRRFSYPVAMEGALKMKEVSYLHAEGYAAGEMKHGPLALVDENFPTVCLAPRDSVYRKMIGSIQEIKSRNGPVIAVGTEGDTHLAELADDVIEIPHCGEMFTPFLSVIALQLLAYYVARERGCDIDRPRNLAKSVTVQ